jgi:hypothetical protein
VQVSGVLPGLWRWRRPEHASGVVGLASRLVSGLSARPQGSRAQVRAQGSCAALDSDSARPSLVQSRTVSLSVRLMTSADVADDDAQPVVHVRCAPPGVSWNDGSGATLWGALAFLRCGW